VDDQVTLSAYADQVRELIRHDRNDEAIAICKHILRYHPKYVDAYRQMGEAHLEQGNYDQAKDLFRRVLSADPENAIAYVGLATIFEQEHVIHEAVWHMERAFELAPGNSELQTELVRLYNAMDIKAHARAKLTPGALGRIYAQEGLFGQAVQEYRSIIASTPSRYDIQVALASALWQMGRLSEAALVAQNILQSLPYCLKANLILGAAWKEAGLAESETYLQRAQMIDPTNQTAVRLLGARSPLAVAQASVPRYIGVEEPTPIAPTPIETAPHGEPSGAMPAQPLAEPTTRAGDEHLPPWLAPSESAQAPEAKPPVAEASIDWLAKLRALPKEEPVADPKPVEGMPDWLTRLEDKPVEQAPTPPGEELPAWLDSQPAPPASPTEFPTETETREPTWLQQLDEPTPALTPRAADELPTWMTPPSSEPVIEGLPSWLAPSTQAPEVSPVSDQPEPAPEPEPPPTWMSNLRAQTETAAAQDETQETMTAPIVEPTPPAPAELAPPSIAEMPTVPAEPKRKRQPKGYARLVQARAHRDANRLNDALAEYDWLVHHAPRLVKDVVDDLAILIQRIDIPLEAHRILGDAYTRVDRLADALEQYRFVLEHVS